jgi:DNA-binding response OmpR family regulator
VSRIAVLDPDEESHGRLIRALEEHRYTAITIAPGEDAFEVIHKEAVQAVVSDLLPGGESGFALCRRLREDEVTRELPFLLITRSASEMDRVLAFESGADDVVMRPFSAKEVALRIRSILQRTGRPDDRRLAPLSLGSVRIEPESRSVRVGDRSVSLSDREAAILRLLALQPGRVLSRQTIVAEIWGRETGVTDRLVDTHVKTMRRKLGPLGDLVRTVRGVGYCLDEDRLR